MVDVTDILSQKSLVLVLAYAPTGLGHLRVTDSLYHGLPSGITPLLMGSQDTSVSYIHRVMSVNPWGRKVMEGIQSGIAEEVFTLLYRNFLRSHTHIVYQQLITILEQRIILPKTILVVSTHFGLAHQLAAIKHTLAREKNVRVILIVVVTDDSPQHIWYIQGADMIFVPSFKTRDQLVAYGKRFGQPPTHFEVIPYPVNPSLTQRLSKSNFAVRKLEVESKSETSVVVSVPISGAAVGLDFFARTFETLSQLSSRFKFHIVAKSVNYTRAFLDHLLEKKYIQLHVATHDREVVDKYEEMYRKEVITLEITKPSEQAFKALVSPTQIGGAILLFSDPVGRQEYDNLDFLNRHQLIPTLKEHEYLWKMASNSSTLNSSAKVLFLQKARLWRGVRLPKDPDETARFIWWCLQNGIFSSMMHFTKQKENQGEHQNELNDDGVKIFWEKVAHYIKHSLKTCG